MSSCCAILTTLKHPWVSVPVLSNTIVSGLDNNSRYELPLTKIPHLEAPPIPAKKPSGTDITNAHGQDITKNVKALFIQTEKLLPK